MSHIRNAFPVYALVFLCTAAVVLQALQCRLPDLESFYEFSTQADQQRGIHTDNIVGLLAVVVIVFILAASERGGRPLELKQFSLIVFVVQEIVNFICDNSLRSEVLRTRYHENGLAAVRDDVVDAHYKLWTYEAAAATWALAPPEGLAGYDRLFGPREKPAKPAWKASRTRASSWFQMSPYGCDKFTNPLSRETLRVRIQFRNDNKTYYGKATDFDRVTLMPPPVEAFSNEYSDEEKLLEFETWWFLTFDADPATPFPDAGVVERVSVVSESVWAGALNAAGSLASFTGMKSTIVTVATIFLLDAVDGIFNQFVAEYAKHFPKGARRYLPVVAFWASNVLASVPINTLRFGWAYANADSKVDVGVVAMVFMLLLAVYIKLHDKADEVVFPRKKKLLVGILAMAMLVLFAGIEPPPFPCGQPSLLSLLSYEELPAAFRVIIGVVISMTLALILGVHSTIILAQLNTMAARA